MTRPPGFLRASWYIAAKDLRIEWRTLETLASMLLFTLVVLVVFSFAFGFSAGREIGIERLVPGVIWTAFSFSAIVGFTRSFQSERRNDTWTALHLSPIDRGSLFLGKMLSNLIKVLLDIENHHNFAWKEEHGGWRSWFFRSAPRCSSRPFRARRRSSPATGWAGCGCGWH